MAHRLSLFESHSAPPRVTRFGQTRITISGNNSVPIRFIDSGSVGQSTVALSNLTFIAATYDFGGGAINNSGALNFDNCTFSDNKANNSGAILSVGKLTVQNSTFSGLIYGPVYVTIIPSCSIPCVAVTTLWT